MRHINVQVHPVDRLELQHHMITQDARHRSCYTHSGLRSSTGPRTHRASSSYIQGMSLQARPESTHNYASVATKLKLTRPHLRPTRHAASHTLSCLVGLMRSLVSIRRDSRRGRPWTRCL